MEGAVEVFAEARPPSSGPRSFLIVRQPLLFGRLRRPCLFMALKSGRRQSATRTRIQPIEFDFGAAAPDVGDKMERSGRRPAALHFCDSVRNPTDGLELP